jgi:sigma-E factor negative regulatory protein RseA
VTQEQVESQLSAMFDGELPAAECELLARRIDRDENLRARWSRYALIGAAMRSEPVATAGRGFAGKVSAALLASDRSGQQRRAVARRRTLWNAALAASMVTAVAGVSIGMLRYSAPGATSAVLARAVGRQPAALTVATPALATEGTAMPGLTPVGIRTPIPSNGELSNGEPSNGEPRSYVTPLNQSAGNTGLRTELADFIVAHSEYSTPLMRRNLLSAFVSSEDASEPPATNAAALGSVRAGQGNATAASGNTAR